MPQAENRSENGPRWWSNAWLRAGLLHPVLFVAPWVALCLLLAELPGSSSSDVDWGFAAVPVGAAASLITTAYMAFRRPVPTARFALIVLLGLVASSAAWALGWVGWYHAAKVACHGAYECPI